MTSTSRAGLLIWSWLVEEAPQAPPMQHSDRVGLNAYFLN
jgi:hypothetical protein